MIDDILFIHIPKTAGRSVYHKLLHVNESKYSKNVEKWMGWDDAHKVWKQHLTMKERIGLYGVDMNEYFSFTFVRNPWDRAVSDYLWLSNENRLSKMTFDCYLNRRGEYMQSILRRTKAYRGDHLTPQYDFIYMDGVPMVDYVGKFENLQNDWSDICDILGVGNVQLPHIGTSNNPGSYRDWYDADRRKLIERMYAKDIENFKYVY